MQCWIWLVTAPSWTHLRCFDGVDVPAWLDSLVALHQSQTSIHFYRCQVGCISASLAALCSGHQASPCQMFHCRQLQTTLQLVVSRRSLPVCFALRTSRKHIESWMQIKLTAR